MKPHQLFFSERIWPCHAGGYWWSVEALEVTAGRFGFNESALGNAAFKWSARRKITRHKREMTRTALDQAGKS